MNFRVNELENFKLFCNEYHTNLEYGSFVSNISNQQTPEELTNYFTEVLKTSYQNYIDYNNKTKSYEVIDSVKLLTDTDQIFSKALTSLGKVPVSFSGLSGDEISKIFNEQLNCNSPLEKNGSSTKNKSEKSNLNYIDKEYFEKLKTDLTFDMADFNIPAEIKKSTQKVEKISENVENNIENDEKIADAKQTPVENQQVFRRKIDISKDLHANNPTVKFAEKEQAKTINKHIEDNSKASAK